MDPHYLYVENLDYGIDEYNEFNHFEDHPTPTSAPSSNIPQPDPISKRPRTSRCTSVVWKLFSIVNKKNIRGEVEDLAEYKYYKKKHIIAKLVLTQVTLKYDWEKGFAFLKFLNVFNDSTKFSMVS